MRLFYQAFPNCDALRHELSWTDLAHQDIGQMDMYVRMYDELRRGPEDNPTVGVILCARKDASAVSPVEEKAFDEIVGMIEQSRQGAEQAVNTFLVDLYWWIGEYLSGKIKADGWGKGTVEALSVYIQRRQPGVRGFSPQNL